jgi:hypothetical protein
MYFWIKRKRKHPTIANYKHLQTNKSDTTRAFLTYLIMNEIANYRLKQIRKIDACFKCELRIY